MGKLCKRMRRREALMALLCLALVLGQIYFDLTMPDYMTDLTKLIQTQGDVAQVWTTGLKMLGCALASAVLCVMAGYLAAKTASGFSYGVREDLFCHVMALGQEEMNAFSIPSLITRTTNDITQIQLLVAMGLQIIIKSPVMAVWAVIKILGKSWELSAVTVGFVVAICLTVLVVMRQVIPRVRRVQKLTDKLNRVARENLIGLSVVHAFNAEEEQNQKFEQVNAEMMRTQLFNQRMFALMQPVMGLGMSGLSLAIYWVGAALLNQLSPADLAGRMTLFSNIVVFSTYATYVVMAFMIMVVVFMLLPAAQVSAERINQVLDTPARIRQGRQTDAEEVGTVEFQDVSFRYPGGAEDELRHISFRVERGQTLAIIGATGSGKTTLVQLIARFYDATEGRVLVDGVDVRDFTFAALYNRLGYVTQKAVLFAGAIEDNVFFGQSRAKPTEENGERAIAQAQAKEFVDQLPEGKRHIIAQAGKNVSGGQKQRLSIARALAREPEILVFDDSFSALDYRTDAKLRAALAQGQATKIIVAQRVSTICHADQILVLDRGQAVGLGSHEELLARCPVYREIAMSQLSGAELGGNQG